MYACWVNCSSAEIPEKYVSRFVAVVGCIFPEIHTCAMNKRHSMYHRNQFRLGYAIRLSPYQAGVKCRDDVCLTIFMFSVTYTI